MLIQPSAVTKEKPMLTLISGLFLNSESNLLGLLTAQLTVYSEGLISPFPSVSSFFFFFPFLDFIFHNSFRFTETNTVDSAVFPYSPSPTAVSPTSNTLHECGTSVTISEQY